MKDVTFQCWNVAILYSKKDLPCHFHSLSLQSYISELWGWRGGDICFLYRVKCHFHLLSFILEYRFMLKRRSNGICYLKGGVLGPLSLSTNRIIIYLSCIMLKRRWKSIYHLNGGVPAPLSRAWTGWAQRQKITKGGKQAKCNLLPNITVNLRSAIAIVQLSVKARLKNNSVYMSTPRKIFRLLVIEANIIVIGNTNSHS